jgi:hypothetical protein
MKNLTEVLKNREILELNYGNFKGPGDAPYNPPKFKHRIGFITDLMWTDTLNTLRGVLQDAEPPKCIFIVHGCKKQVAMIASEIKSKRELYKIGNREVLF